MAVIEVTKDNFEKEVLKSDKKVLIDFNADWCGPCRMLRPIVDERNLEVMITDKGKRLKDKALSIPEKMGKCIDLSKEEATTLYKLMYKILMNVERNDE